MRYAVLAKSDRHSISASPGSYIGFVTAHDEDEALAKATKFAENRGVILASAKPFDRLIRWCIIMPSRRHGKPVKIYRDYPEWITYDTLEMRFPPFCVFQYCGDVPE